MERSAQNVTTVSHVRPLVPWLRPRAPIPSGAYHAWVSLRPGPGTPSSVGRAWCPPGFIRQNGVCTGKAKLQLPGQGHSHCCLGQLGWACGHHAPCSETQASQAGGVGVAFLL